MGEYGCSSKFNSVRDGTRTRLSISESLNGSDMFCFALSHLVVFKQFLGRIRELTDATSGGLALASLSQKIRECE